MTLVMLAQAALAAMRQQALKKNGSLVVEGIAK